MSNDSKFFRLVKSFQIFNRNKMGSNCTKNRRNFVSPESTILTDTEINLLLASTTMSREQIIDFHLNFIKDCPNGILTKKEFCKMFKELHNNDSKTQRVEKFSEYVFK